MSDETCTATLDHGNGRSWRCDRPPGHYTGPTVHEAWSGDDTESWHAGGTHDVGPGRMHWADGADGAVPAAVQPHHHREQSMTIESDDEGLAPQMRAQIEADLREATDKATKRFVVTTNITAPYIVVADKAHDDGSGAGGVVFLANGEEVGAVRGPFLVSVIQETVLAARVPAERFVD